MKPEHNCLNHPDVEAVGSCNDCNEWFCAACLVEGPKNYYCCKKECLQKLEIEKAFQVGKCPSCGTVVESDAEQCEVCGLRRTAIKKKEKMGCYYQYRILMLLLGLGYGLIVTINNIWLVSTGVKTKGTILRAHSNSLLSKRPNWELEVRFFSEKDKKDITAEITDHSFAPRKEFDTIDLLYDPNHPKQVMANNFLNLWEWVIVVGSVLLMFLCVHYYFRRLMRDDD
jgi:hypothetical protein